MLRYMVAAIAALLACSAASSAKPLPIRAWEFQDYNLEHMKRLVDMAAKCRINRIHLSHDILMYAMEPVKSPTLAADINTICDLAHSKGIKVDVWSRELADIPAEFVKDGKIDLADPRTWAAIQDKYRKLFAACPKVDGVVITMSEGSVAIWNDAKVSSPLSAEDRLQTLIDKVDEVCREYGKEVYCRSFAYTPGDLEVIQKGTIRAKADVISMPKCVPHDWQPYYPFSPEIGEVGNKRQVVEFDLGHEFTGLSTIPYINIEYMKRHLDYGISKGICGAVFRIERMKWWAVDTPNQAVIDVASTLLVDPSADPYKLYRQWLADRYPAEAVPHLYSAFIRTQEIVEKGLFVLGDWVTNHSKVPNYGYAHGHLEEYRTAKWDPSEFWLKNEQDIHHPTLATIRRIQAEKDHAIKLANASIGDIEKAKPYLKPADYEHLSDLFQREKAMVVVWKAAMEVIFGIDVYKADKSEPNKRFLAGAAGRLKKATDLNSKHLINMLADYTNPRPTGNADAAYGLVKEAQKVMAE